MSEKETATTDKKPRTKRKPITCDADCRNAKPEAKKYSRDCSDGMTFWVYPNGRKQFSYRYRRPTSRMQNSISIGDYYEGGLSLKEAKAIRNEYNNMVERGIDPSLQIQEERQQQKEATTSLTTIILNFLANESPKHKGHKWEALRLNKIMRDFPEMCALPVSELHQRHMNYFRDKRLQEVAGVSVGREMQLLGGVIRYAIREMHVLTDSPLKDVRRPEKGAHRERRVTNEEIERICKACKYEPDQPPHLHKQQTAWAFLFAIETAMRASEICRMTWENVHPSYVHLPDTKNNSTRNVPLSLKARELLEQARGIDETRVLTVDEGSMCSTFYRAKDAAGFSKDDNLHFHDSRHEATTRLAQTFPNVADLAKITGHKDLKRLLTYYNPTAQDLADRLERAQGQTTT